MKKLAIACAVSVALQGICIAPANAAAIWGATEWTQYANFGVLSADLVEAIATTTNTYNTVMNLKRQLEQLSPEALKSVLREMGVDMDAIVAIADNLNEARTAYKDLVNTVERDLETMERLAQNPAQYLKLRMNLAEKKGGVYKLALDADLKVLANAKERSQSLKAAMNNAKGIATHVQGFQALASMNAQLGAALNDLNQTIAQEHIAHNREREAGLLAQKQVQESQKRAINTTITPTKGPTFGNVLDHVGNASNN